MNDDVTVGVRGDLPASIESAITDLGADVTDSMGTCSSPPMALMSSRVRASAIPGSATLRDRSGMSS